MISPCHGVFFFFQAQALRLDWPRQHIVQSHVQLCEHPGSCAWARHLLGMCEGGVDVVGVVTPLVRGLAQVLHGDQVVELSVQLEVQEVEGKEEDREGQIEVEDERGELKERRTCTWMTSDETQT